MEGKRVGVGVGIMILRGSKVLLGLRNPDPKKADSELHGEGTWTMPGGKVHFGETYKEAAVREVYEETGISVRPEDLTLICVNDEILPDVHFVTIGLLCTRFEGEPEVREPEEILRWQWFDLDDLPDNMYPPSRKIIEAYMLTGP